MRRFEWRWLAVSSLLIGAMTASAETRPQYGGTVRVAMHAAPTSLDPADGSQPDSFARRSLTMLIFDTLVQADENGRLQTALAVSWQASPGNQRWQFHLRRGVKFHDGSPLTTESVAASLRVANPLWNVSIDGESIVIEQEAVAPELPAELALPRNAIAKRSSDGRPDGTGPFHVVDWQPGKKLTLAAEETYWGGRSFLDGVEIEMGRGYRDQMVALELGRADLVEVPPEQIHRAAMEGRALVSSPPMELMALVFTRDAASPDEKTLREALALSVERASIRGVLLQGSGQPAASILPTWMSGYGFVFPTSADLARARQLRAQVRNVPSWTVGYDATDAVARLVADRIALNARDAGLSLQPTTAITVDLRLVRIPLASADPWITLASAVSAAGSSPVKNVGGNVAGSVEDLYAAEQAALAAQKIIPLFHLPVSCAAAPTLRSWTLRSNGTWALSDAWLGGVKP